MGGVTSATSLCDVIVEQRKRELQASTRAKYSIAVLRVVLTEKTGSTVLIYQMVDKCTLLNISYPCFDQHVSSEYFEFRQFLFQRQLDKRRCLNEDR